MRYITLLLLITLTFNIKIIGHTVMVGGYSDQPLNQINEQINEFIKKQIPQLSSAQIVRAQTQVVSGINYRYTYRQDDTIWKVTVWDESWLNNRRITQVDKVEQSVNSQGKKVQTTTSVIKQDFYSAISDLF